MDNLSIIIPVKHIDEPWRELLSELLGNPAKFEVIVVGPDFKDITPEDPRVRFIYSKAGRALQQNIGAIKATRSSIWFLHADSRLSNRTLQKVEAKLKENCEAIYYFDLNFLPDGPRMMVLNSVGAYWRSHILKMPFGDQGFFMARKTFFSLGLFDEKALYGEDHLLIWRAHQRGVEVLPAYSEIFTSARKYRNLGWITATARHVVLTYKQALPQWLTYLRSRRQKKFTTAIAIFVKTPGHSPVKSRLAETIGREKAEEFFRLSLKATEALVLEAIKKSEGKIEAYWAVAERDTLQNPLWNSFNTIYQGSGELGDRLATVYSKLQKKHKRVFLIGADLPHLDYKTLLRAQFKLKSSTGYILGETDDGGFYLFGARGVIERAVWNAIPYSTQETASTLMQKLGNSNFTLLDKNFDIDYIEDLKKLSKIENCDLLPEQQEVINWIKPILSAQT
ncbi:MAG: DUF2064 domain-containing protein [Bacteriovorax sp.]|jgi:glycosyltransferase A (GT-A) superfamily protein (DUF2064 family)